MTTIIRAIMAGMIAATALAALGTSASAAISPKGFGVHQGATTVQVRQIDRSPVVKAVWSGADQQMFWEQEEDRGG